tara:strand:+ start:5171 stop:6736 length:1566 start_codon:yes stop_codon:yes gene_type:complete
VTDLLEFSGVTKRFGAFTALDGIDVGFAAGEIHCLLGENGAGKSTLCNLAFGIFGPSEGALAFDGAAYRPEGPKDALTAGIAMVHQHFSLVNDMSVVDNLMLGQARGFLDRKSFAARLTELGEKYGLSMAPFARVGDLSIGERQRVEIVKCLMREPRLLILDEPTAVLLPDEISALLDVCRAVAESGCAVILVTHKLAEIKQVADRVTVLRGGRIVARSDSPADNIDALVRAMVGRDIEELDSFAMTSIGVDSDSGASAREAPTTAGATAVTGDEVAQFDGISVRDSTGALRLDNFTVTVRRGEIVGIAGVEGNGQSELGDLIAGLTEPQSGRFHIDNDDLTGATPAKITESGVGVVPEDRHRVAAIVEMTLMENMLLNRIGGYTRYGLMNRRAMRSAADRLTELFDVRAAGLDVPFGSLSGGNQQKAVLARELSTPNLRFLLAAQPTRGLDVGAVEAVYRMIRQACDRGAGVLLISSELDEILAVANRVVVLYRGRIIGERPAHPRHRAAIGAMMAGQSA